MRRLSKCLGHVPVHLCLAIATCGALGGCASGPTVPVDVREITPAPRDLGLSTVSASYLEQNPKVEVDLLTSRALRPRAPQSRPSPGVSVPGADERVVVRPLHAADAINTDQGRQSGIRTEPLGPTSVTAVPAPVASPTPSADSLQSDTGVMHSNPAVAELVAQAERERQAGNLPRAAAAVERALRITPHDADLWHQLAALRLEQGQTRQAEDFARKSDALAGDDTRLRAANSALIRASRG